MFKEPLDQELREFVIHECQDPLVDVMVPRVGKKDTELASEIKETQAKYAKQGIELVRRGESWEFIHLQEKRGKPKAYATEFRGNVKTLTKWIQGETLVDGYSIVQTTPSHLRTWCGAGSFVDIAGQVHREKVDKAGFLKYWGDSNRFSDIVWVDSWQEFSKLR